MTTPKPNIIDTMRERFAEDVWVSDSGYPPTSLAEAISEAGGKGGEIWLTGLAPVPTLDQAREMVLNALSRVEEDLADEPIPEHPMFCWLVWGEHEEHPDGWDIARQCAPEIEALAKRIAQGPNTSLNYVPVSGPHTVTSEIMAEFGSASLRRL